MFELCQRKTQQNRLHIQFCDLLTLRKNWSPSGDCSAIRPNQAPLPWSFQGIPDSVSSPTKEVNWRSSRPMRFRQYMRRQMTVEHAPCLHYGTRILTWFIKSCANACALDETWDVKQLCRNACVLRPTRFSVFTSSSRARHSFVSGSKIWKRTNHECAIYERVKTPCYCICHFSLIFDLASHLLATLATVEHFPCIACSTVSLTLTMTMTAAPMFHGWTGTDDCFVGIGNGTLLWTNTSLSSPFLWRTEGVVLSLMRHRCTFVALQLWYFHGMDMLSEIVGFFHFNMKWPLYRNRPPRVTLQILCIFLKLSRNRQFSRDHAKYCWVYA